MANGIEITQPERRQATGTPHFCAGGAPRSTGPEEAEPGAHRPGDGAGRSRSASGTRRVTQEQARRGVSHGLEVAAALGSSALMGFGVLPLVHRELPPDVWFDLHWPR